MRIRSNLATLALTATLAASGQEGAILPWPVQEALRSEARRPGVLRMPGTDGVAQSLAREHPGLPTFADSAVQYWIERWTTVERDAFRGMLAVWQEQRPFIEAQLHQAGLPSEISLLPLALTSMDLHHRSLRGAGPWSLSHAVAVRYGLRVSDAVDERHHLLLSTVAAVAHMRSLVDAFATQDLQLLAISCGPANAVRASQRAPLARTLAELHEHVDAPEREVVPRWMAALHIVDRLSEMGVTPLVLASDPPTDTCRTTRPMVRDQLIRSLALDPALCAWLNPTLVGRTVPAGTTLVLPGGSCPRLQSVSDSLHAGATQAAQAQAPAPVEDEEERTPDGRETVYHRVTAGEVLGRIAERYGVTVAELRRWNALKGDHIDVGEVLTLHVTPAVKRRLDRNEPAPAPKHPTHDQDHSWYTVRQGDSLYNIAKRFPGISADSLMRFNGIGPDIRPGQRIRIPTR
ncbi:MAG: LysM peptidoglycan-binding domain-containing protein [Flavobacteriales bacterium]